MVRHELLWIILVSLIWSATSQEIRNSAEGSIGDKDEPPDKLILQKSQPYAHEDQQSYMSKIVSWIFPFGGTSEDRSDVSGGYQYVPAPPSQSHIEKDCNPCNQEPWIPVTSVGQKNLINVHPSIKNFGGDFGGYADLSALKTLNPPPVPYRATINQYGPPPQFRPKDIKNNFGLANQQPVQNSVPLPFTNDIYVVDYMLPPPVNYRLPSLIYGPPNPSYGSPPGKPVYGPPLQPTYLPPKPKPIYNPAIHTGNNQFPGQPNTFLSPPTYHENLPQNPGRPFLNGVNFPPNSFGYEGDKNIAVVPSDSYGVPVTGDSLHYFAPPEQLSLANENKGYIEKPIPLPNLSMFPVPPIHNPQNFNQNTIGSRQGEETNVKIQESVKIADYLATIEHPINVIQSPIIELSINDEEGEKAYNDNNESVNQNTVYSEEKNHNKVFNQELQNFQVQTERDENHGNLYSDDEHFHDYDITPTKLSEHPIVVEDIHAAASSNNDTVVSSNEVSSKRSNGKDLKTYESNPNPVTGTNIIKELLLNNKITPAPTKYQETGRKGVSNNFTISPLDYSDWKPTYGVTMTKLSSILPTKLSTTTKKPKLVQIIVPYVNKPSTFPTKKWTNKNIKKSFQTVNYDRAYTTLVPVFTPPSTTGESVWTKFMTFEQETSTATPKTTTGVYNIKELLNMRTELPYDIILLQKHIDQWTQQAYSQNKQRENKNSPTAKEIPSEYFATEASNIYTEITTIKNDVSSTKNPDDNVIDSNFYVPSETTTEEVTSTTKSVTERSENKKQLWNASHVTVSPQTKEKVYIVTPQTYNFYTSTPATAWSTAPKIENGKVNNRSTYDSYRFSIRVEPEDKNSREKLKRNGKEAVKIVYSEWPHLINNLQTTTSKPPSRHPLFGLMEFPQYTPPPNSTIETISGHSRVALAVTAASVPESVTIQRTPSTEAIK